MACSPPTLQPFTLAAWPLVSMARTSAMVSDGRSPPRESQPVTVSELFAAAERAPTAPFDEVRGAWPEARTSYIENDSAS